MTLQARSQAHLARGISLDSGESYLCPKHPAIGRLSRKRLADGCGIPQEHRAGKLSTPAPPVAGGQSGQVAGHWLPAGYRRASHALVPGELADLMTSKGDGLEAIIASIRAAVRSPNVPPRNTGSPVLGGGILGGQAARGTHSQIRIQARDSISSPSLGPLE